MPSLTEVSSSTEYLKQVVASQGKGKPRGIYSVCTADPMVLRAALKQALEDAGPALVEATSNQVNQFGGYTGMEPAGFVQFMVGLAREMEFPPARLCQAAEASFKTRSRAGGAEEPPLYVIGSDVPPPGGEISGSQGPDVTTPREFEETVALTRAAFHRKGLGDAWERVIAVVVQPGVEFGEWQVHPYDGAAASSLTRAMTSHPGLAFEGHSTDDQTPGRLRQMAEDGITVLKVLTPMISRNGWGFPVVRAALQEALSKYDHPRVITSTRYSSTRLLSTSGGMRSSPNRSQGMVDLIHTHGVAPKGAAGLGVYDAIDMFHQGRVAMGYGGIYEIGRIDRYYRSGQLPEPFDVVVAQFPHDPSVGPVAYQVNGGFVVFRQPSQERRDLVMEFARFITNTENAGLLEDLLYFSSRRSANEKMSFDQVQAYTDVREQVQVYLTATEYGVPYYGPTHVDVGEVMPHLMSAVQAALNLDKTPQQALDEFVREAGRVVFGR